MSIVNALQKNLKNRLNPASRPLAVPKELVIPPADFHMGPSNGMYLRQTLDAIHERGYIEGYSYPSRAPAVEIRLADDMMEKLLDLSGGFTRYDIGIARSIKRKSSLRLYWLICSWRSRGGFQLPVANLCVLLGLGPGYKRTDNIVTHILEPAQRELAALQETWFTYRLIDGTTISFKIHYTLTEEEKLQLSRDAWDQCFRLLTAAGLSFRIIADIFPRIRPEDLPAFVDKLRALLADLSHRRDLRNKSAYIKAALNSSFPA